MSRNMRAACNKWADAGSVFLDLVAFRDLVRALLGKETDFTYVFSDADEVFKLFLSCGKTFLDLVKNCDVARTVKTLRKPLRPDATRCLENLKALEPAWREFVDKDGHLEVWVDAY